jgi:hypothetical protein
MKQYNDRADAIPPQTLGEFDVHIARSLDLTDESVLKVLGTKVEDLTDLFDHNLPRMIGAAAWSIGIEALNVFFLRSLQRRDKERRHFQRPPQTHVQSRPGKNELPYRFS